MKKPPNQTAFESAPDMANYTPGKLPKLKFTVVASVLASSLESKQMTGMESVFKQSTTRLGAVIHYLENRYDWTFNRRKIATGTNDGRVAEITAYWLPQATIAQAFAAGAADWVEGVKVARVERRKQSEKCKSDAAKINARKHFKNHDPRQNDFWSGL